MKNIMRLSAKQLKNLVLVAVIAFGFFAFHSAFAQTAPTVDLVVSDNDIPYGDSVDLYWYPHNATSCIGTGGANGWAGSKYYYSSSFYTGALYQTTTFTLTCSNAFGSGSDSVTVYVAGGPVSFPTVNLTADNTNVSYNGSTTIRWNTTNANSCEGAGGSNGWAGSKNIPNGTFNTGAITSTNTYTLTCTNNSGSETKSITLNVGSQPNNNPTVSTSSATNVGYNSANLNGFVSANGGSFVYGYFEWGTNGNLNNQTTKVNYGATSGNSFSYALGGLSSNTTYYFRAVAEGSNGQIVHGNQLTFTTISSGGCTFNCGTNVPSVTTYSATNINDTYATLNGYVNPNQSNTTRWFEYGTSSTNLSSQTTHISQGTTSGNFSQSVTNLSPNTIYYFRAVAQNSNGTTYGNVMNFNSTNSSFNPNTCGTNSLCTPTAVTTVATNIDHNSARLNGLGLVSGASFGISNNGYFEWGTTQNLGNTTSNSYIGNTDSNPFYASLFGLTPNTTYYFRAVVNNQYGTSRGEIRNFRTGNITVVNTNTTNTTNVVYRDRVVVTNTETVSTTKPSLVFLNIQNNGETIVNGGMVNYVTYYKNVSGESLKDVVLTIALPKELQFLETNRGYFSAENNTVVVEIGNLFPNEEGTVVVRVGVKETAEIGKILVVTANLGYTSVSDNTQAEVFAYSKNEVILGGTQLAGASIFGGGFLPNTLLGWMLLILIIVLIILAARRAYKTGTVNRA